MIHQRAKFWLSRVDTDWTVLHMPWGGTWPWLYRVQGPRWYWKFLLILSRNRYTSGWRPLRHLMRKLGRRAGARIDWMRKPSHGKLREEALTDVSQDMEVLDQEGS